MMSNLSKTMSISGPENHPINMKNDVKVPKPVIELPKAISNLLKMVSKLIKFRQQPPKIAETITNLQKKKL